MPLYPVCTVLSCLYKEGDREDINNWHLISLHNYDRKIYAKILANKIQLTLVDITVPEQTAVIKGRTTIENLQLNQDVMSYANTNKIQAAVMVLDQEKAFDRMDWNFLFKALQNFEYGPEVTQKIKTVYQNLETQVKINGRAFPVKRGFP